MKPLVLLRPLGDNPPKAHLYYGQHVLDSLKQLPADSVHVVCTSPPYWGLRDYKTPEVQFGNWKGHLGQEPSVLMYVEHLVQVFRQVRRVLRPDGTFWLNLGDSYSTRTSNVLKEKDLAGVPWRVALALQADGWWLRNDIVWEKTSCMPEAVKDRCTRNHEYVFMFSKSKRYYYDQDAIREDHKPESLARVQGTHHTKDHKWADGPGAQTLANDLTKALHPGGGNKRTVWKISPKGYKGAHFATWPTKLVEPMVLAGSSARGCCASCGAPYRRLVELVGKTTGRRKEYGTTQLADDSGILNDSRAWKGGDVPKARRIQKGWEAGCGCKAEMVPCTVLDPFSGSATTGKVAWDHGRDYIGIDLKADYLEMAQARLTGRKAPVSAGESEEDDLISDLFR